MSYTVATSGEQGGLGWYMYAVLIVALLTFLFTWLAFRNSVRKSDYIFRKVRALLRSRRVELTKKALDKYAYRYHHRTHRGAPLLIGEGWVPENPLPLDQVGLRLIQENEAFSETVKRARYLLPYDTSGTQFYTYADALQAVLTTEAKTTEKQPPRFENRQSYRLLRVHPSEFRLDLARGSYFDHQNTDEIVGYETARAVWREENAKLAYWFGRNERLRRWLGSPFDLRKRCVIPGVSTLTIRKAGEDSRFFMHERTRVALAQGTEHVTPAGEFQPSLPGEHLFESDCDLWKNIQREYHEEFLGAPESWDTGCSPDYERDKPFAEFNDVYRSGGLKLWFLGIGLDPLTLKAEILTCAIWEHEAFDRVFEDILERNDEGTLLIGKDRKGITLTTKRLAAYRDSPRILSAGRACIELFMEHRVSLME